MQDNIFVKSFMDSLSESQQKEYRDMSINMQKDWYISYLESNFSTLNKADVKSALENMYMLGGNPRPDPKYNQYLQNMINIIMGKPS